MAQTKSGKRTAARESDGQENPVVGYIRQTRGELRKVVWPSREESQRLTAIVLGVTALMALFLGLLDFIFSNTIQSLVQFVAGV